MAKVNWGRWVAGGALAGLVCFVTDGFLHEKLVAGDWQAAFDALHAAHPSEHDPSAFAYFGLYDLGRGLTSIFAYVMMRSRFKPGPKTAVLAGIASWFAMSIAGPAQFVPMGFFPFTLWVKVGAFQLVSTVLATLAGAACYKEGK